MRRMPNRFFVQQRMVNVLAALLALAPLIWLAIELPTLPDIVPAHFSFGSNPGRWRSKYELPLIGEFPLVINLICLVSQHFRFANLPPAIPSGYRCVATAGIGLASVIVLDAAAFWVFHLVCTALVIA